MSRIHAAPCRHCRRVLVVVGRGLCSSCFRVPEIRERYPKLFDTRPIDRGMDDPTEAELDALIESQRPTMPTEHGAYDTFGLLPASRYGRAACPVPTMGRRVMRKAWRH